MATAKKIEKERLPSTAADTPPVRATTEAVFMPRPRRIYTDAEIEEITIWLATSRYEPNEAMIRAMKTYKRFMAETVEH